MFFIFLKIVNVILIKKIRTANAVLIFTLYFIAYFDTDFIENV